MATSCFTSSSITSNTPEAQLKSLGYDLDAMKAPMAQGSYVSCVEAGSFLWTSGHLPIRMDGSIINAKVKIRFFLFETF